MVRAVATLTIVALLLLAVWLFATFVRRNGMFFPDKFPIGDWQSTVSDHYFTTPDGVRLHGWLFEASDANAPLLIWFHGNAGNLTNRAEMAAELARRGVSVFLFDWRGYGKSDGTASEKGLYLDALAAYDYAKPRARGPITIYGESLGGPYAAYVAKERKGAHGVVIENSFPSLRELGNALYRPLPLGWMAPFSMRTSAWLNEAGIKVLVMHGTRDRVIPYSLGKKLYDDLRVPKEMLTADAGHAEIPSAEGDRYYAAVVRFAK